MTPISPLYPAALAAFCGLAFLWRFFLLHDRNWFYIGRAFGYGVLVWYYGWAFQNLESPDRIFWGRWAVTIFLFINALYFVQEMVMIWMVKHVRK